MIAASTSRHSDSVTASCPWSRRDPVTLFGALLSSSGWQQLSADFANVASWFSDWHDYDLEVVAAGASGDLAYMVGYEHNIVKVNSKLRSTHVYRREDGHWKIVHRHADTAPGDTATTFEGASAAAGA